MGKCSLTVALPVISAMGVECSVLPTAVLSTHTMFKNFTFRDLTCDIEPVAKHWKDEKLGFDAIYTGFLGSFEQLELVSNFIDDFRNENNVVFIDPVMADHGKIYTCFSPEFALAMAKLCTKADIVVPNMTEAAFMLEIPYRAPGEYDEAYVKDILKRLADMGAKNAVLTGAQFNDKELGVMGYKSETDEFFAYFHPRLDASYHGTGDIFSSTAVGALMNGLSLEKSLALAADFTAACMKQTMASPDRVWYGVEFEPVIPELLKMLKNA